MGVAIRLAQPEDAEQVAAIYGPFCTDTPVSFEMVAPSPIEMAQRIRKITAQFPWLVLTEDDRVAGYVYAGAHRERAAYRWSADVTAYMAPAFRRRGVGRALYITLLALLEDQGYFKAYAGITLPNPASVGLHEAVGFQAVGIYRGVGYKMGVWHDVVWYQRELRSECPDPVEPRPLADILNTPAWEQALATGVQLFQSVAKRS
jgi:phosphinothricin acetyltransferase